MDGNESASLARSRRWKSANEFRCICTMKNDFLANGNGFIGKNGSPGNENGFIGRKSLSVDDFPANESRFIC